MGWWSWTIGIVPDAEYKYLQLCKRKVEFDCSYEWTLHKAYRSGGLVSGEHKKKNRICIVKTTDIKGYLSQSREALDRKSNPITPDQQTTSWAMMLLAGLRFRLMSMELLCFMTDPLQGSMWEGLCCMGLKLIRETLGYKLRLPIICLYFGTIDWINIIQAKNNNSSKNRGWIQWIWRCGNYVSIHRLVK